MKTNKDILSESFFKKETYAEKQQEKMPQYSPLDPKGNGTLGGQVSLDHSAFAVKDPDELKKRLIGTFGAAFGNNNVKAMANRAIKSFPIIISDNIEPDTAVMLKNLMETQYAEYLSLLISNQVIDLSAYSTADSTQTGNIAIQALDAVSGNDFSSTRVANKAYKTGELSKDDIFANVPLYNLLRTESMELKTGNLLMDTLLEGAMVVPADHTADAVSYMQTHCSEIAALNEWYDPDAHRNDPFQYARDTGQPHRTEWDDDNADQIDNQKNSRYQNLSDYINSDDFDNFKVEKSIVRRDITQDKLRGYQGVDANGNEVYNKLTNTKIVVDRDMLQKNLNRSIGETLMLPENAVIRDKFEKATYLLQSRMISGKEYISYCVMRLGIPVSNDDALSIETEYREDKVVQINGTDNNLLLPVDSAEGIEAATRNIETRNNRANKVISNIMHTKVGTALGATLTVGVPTAVGTGIAAAATGAAGTGMAIGSIASLPGVLIGAIAGAVVGTASYIVGRVMANRRRAAAIAKHGHEGWERVEALIDRMEKQQAEIRNKANHINTNDNMGRDAAIATKVNVDSTYKDFSREKSNVPDTNEEDDKDRRLATMQAQLDSIRHQMESIAITESTDLPYITKPVAYNMTINAATLDDYNDILSETCDEVSKDKDFCSAFLAESLISSVPMKIKYIEKKPGKDVMISPTYAARDDYAYGSTEIERRDQKDRRYDQPLIVTVKFKERYDDGKFSDNELTAVIGILGKIIRVPSEEMKYILKSNADGETINGLLKVNSDTENLVGDLLSNTKINKDMKNLPQSADVWNNLEKVAHLAITNKLTGNKTSNVANAHIVFSQKEVDDLRSSDGIDYLKDIKLTQSLMKHYSAFTLMIANDPGQRLYIYDDPDDISWNVVPYNALTGKDTGDQLAAALAKLGRI